MIGDHQSESCNRKAPQDIPAGLFVGWKSPYDPWLSKLVSVREKALRS